jgi:hypothetical protein
MMKESKTTPKKVKSDEICGHAAQPSPIINQVIRRPVTNLDEELISRFYQNLQNRMRGLAVISLGLVIINYFLLSDILMDWFVSLIFYFAMLLTGAVSIGLSLNILLTRKRISSTLKEGTVVEVRAPAYRSRLVPKTAWTVGPISLIPIRGTSLDTVQEGMQVRVLCIPSMKMALSINDIGMKYGARITCPPNLEAMAVLEQGLPHGANKEEEIDEIEATIDNTMSSDERLTKLKELKDKGLITEKDYENKKKEILVDI